MPEKNRDVPVDDLISISFSERTAFMIDISGSMVQHPDLRTDSIAIKSKSLTSYARSWFKGNVKKEGLFSVESLEKERKDIP